jgi:hypothetical protein
MLGIASGPRPGAALMALLLVGLLGGRSARAASDVVILFEPSVATAGQHRCLTRIREELLAGGFQVTVIDPGSKTDPISIAQALQQPSDAAASIALLGDPTIEPAELWIVDRTGARPDVRRIATPSDDPLHAPEILAIRTIELLRASALQRLVESTRIQSPSQPAPAQPASAPPATALVPTAPEERPRVGIELGVAVVEDLSGPGPAEIPVARLHVALPGSLFARLTVAALGSRPRVESAEGSATVGQSLGLLEVGATFRSQYRLRPIVTLGAGALYVTSDGEGVYPYLGHPDSRWTALFDGGLGLFASLSRQWGLAVEVHVLVAAPQPFVRFSQSNAGNIGRPALAAALTLVRWL